MVHLHHLPSISGRPKMNRSCHATSWQVLPLASLYPAQTTSREKILWCVLHLNKEGKAGGGFGASSQSKTRVECWPLARPFVETCWSRARSQGRPDIAWDIASHQSLLTRHIVDWVSELTFWLVSKSGWTQKERRLWACCIAARKMLVYTKTLVISGLMILSPVLFEEWLDSCICPRTVSPHWKCLLGNQSGLSQITTHQNITCKGCQPSLWKRHSSIKFRNLPTKGFARRNRHDSPAYRRADRLAPRPGRILRTQSFRRDTSEQRCHLWRRFMDFLASRLPKAMSVRPTYTVLGTGREDEDPLLGCVVNRCLPWGRGLEAFMLGYLGY